MEQILEKLNLVHAPVRVISGTVSEGEENLEGRDVDVFRPGSVRYVAAETLRPLLRLRGKVHKVLRQNSAPFLSVRAVSDNAIDGVQAQLVALEAEIDAEREKFIQNFPRYVQDWVSKHPEVAKYSARFPDEALIRTRTGMDVSVFKIHPQQVKTQRDGIDREVKGLAGRILYEVAQDIEESWDPGAAKGTEKIRGVIRRVIDKLDGLAFVDQNLGHVATMAREVLQRMPVTGVINGVDYVILSGLLKTLSDPKNVVNVARQIAAGTSPTDVWKPIVDTLAQPAQDAAAPAHQVVSDGAGSPKQDVAAAATQQVAADDAPAKPIVLHEDQQQAHGQIPVVTERPNVAAAYNW